MQKLRYFLEQSWLLVASSFVFGLLLAVTSAALSPRIEQHRINKLNRLAGGLLREAEDFVPIHQEFTVTSLKGRPGQVQVYKAMAADRHVGWSFNVAGSGFADKIELVVAVNEDFTTLAGFDVLASNETPGFGDKIKDANFRDQFEGAPVGPLTLIRTGEPKDDEIVAIAGATVSSKAVVEIISHYVPRVKQQMQEQGLLGNGG